MGPGFESLKVHQKEKHHLAWCFFFLIPKGNELPKRSVGTFAYRLRYLRREDSPSGVTQKMERIAEIYPEQHILEVHFAHLWVRTSKSHSRRTSPSQVFGSCDSLLCRTPFQKTIINYFCSLTGSGAPKRRNTTQGGAFHKADLTYRENQSRRGDS